MNVFALPAEARLLLTIATLTPLAIATGEAIDGSVDAFNRDHPEMGEGEDAGDLFAQAHGDAELDEELEEAAK